ncbi:hypothetical protein protein [Bacillus cereus G9241]|uniref:Uncharacterized protein n=2 Tax=Bacillus cereus TaxID=1396 RepID=Q733N5_BACC1|nr:hypothetical protein BCE_3623 [Bacillus cereus ATCC 10987]ACM13825.1 conserved hypothetical protein [Bacillus cereus Q1]EAL13707.1 hypothetical protein protein [Bacillus cereus G9241]KLA12944.1 hypothetical protein B4087_3640 [Bacillus cereus]BAR75672.1 hypothetical protein BASH2_02265 [Bacillus anthracis]
MKFFARNNEFFIYKKEMCSLQMYGTIYGKNSFYPLSTHLNKGD